MRSQKWKDEKACGEQVMFERPWQREPDEEVRKNKAFNMHAVRYILLSVLLLFVLVLPGLLTACGGQQQAQNPAGTATQDPPIPHLTEATHGILDTTGTVPQSMIAQLRTRSDDVQAHGFQIAVVFFHDVASDAHQFATNVFNTNGIGYKDKNNGVLFVLYLQKQGKDGHAPWLSYITGGGISGALPDTLMDDYAQTTFVPARAQGNWQDGLLAFYDKVFTAEQDPSIAQEWQTTHPKQPTATSPTGSTQNYPNGILIAILGCIAIVGWLVVSAIVAARRRENFFYTAFRLLGRFLFLLVIFSRSTRGGSSSGGSGLWGGGGGGSGSWGGGGSSPSSGGDV
jgi:uncharacterized protein